MAGSNEQVKHESRSRRSLVEVHGVVHCVLNDHISTGSEERDALSEDGYGRVRSGSMSNEGRTGGLGGEGVVPIAVDSLWHRVGITTDGTLTALRGDHSHINVGTRAEIVEDTSGNGTRDKLLGLWKGSEGSRRK